ncbi:MAG: amidohydrolase family protein [bacterium]
MQLDCLIKNATVFDGNSIDEQRLDVGISGERIAYVGDGLSSSSGKEIVEAHGLYLCPGFIDTHASTGLGYMLPHAGDNKLYQGVTTEIIGNCGSSTAPIGELLLPTMAALADQIGFRFSWRSLRDWLELIEAHGLPFNSGTLIGHNTLRTGICADAQTATPNEILQMGDLLEQALQDGALGLSTGLVYAPGSFAETSEIIDLATVVARYGGNYASHIRNERESLEDSIEEAIEIGRRASVPVLVSHLKAAEKPNWGKIPRVIETIEAARAQGIKITFEVYPYTAVSTKLRTFLPKESLSDGLERMVSKLKRPDWRERCIAWLESRQTDFATMVLITESVSGGRGRSIQEIAEQEKRRPAEMLVDILIRDPEAWIVYHCISEADMEAALLWPASIVCSDSWSYPVNAPDPIGDPHPRTYGAFTRFLEKYAIRNQIIPFGLAVKKISSFASDFLGLANRGRIREGNFADLTLLDPTKVKELATFEKPRQFSEGTEFVWVNGTKMIERGALLNALPGKVVKRGQHVG